jgi:hypothetical protein
MGFHIDPGHSLAIAYLSESLDGKGLVIDALPVLPGATRCGRLYLALGPRSLCGTWEVSSTSGLVCRAGSGRRQAARRACTSMRKSDEAILLAKRLNKGRQLLRKSWTGLTQGEQPLGGRGSDTEPKCRVDPNNGCAAGDERDQIVHRTMTDPREEPGALAALAGIWAGGEEQSSSLPRPSSCGT